MNNVSSLTISGPATLSSGGITTTGTQTYGSGNQTSATQGDRNQTTQQSGTQNQSSQAGSGGTASSTYQSGEQNQNATGTGSQQNQQYGTGNTNKQSSTTTSENRHNRQYGDHDRSAGAGASARGDDERHDNGKHKGWYKDHGNKHGDRDD